MEKKSKLVNWRFTRKQNVGFGRALYLSGNIPELGNWDPAKAIRLQCCESDNWSVQVDVPYDKPMEYKYIEGGFDDVKTNMKWEGGDNRKLNLSDILHYRDGLSIMTFNVRYYNEKDGDNNWANRRDNVCKMILSEFPCILGIQEALPQQRSYLQDKLKEYYNYVGIARDLNKGEEGGIFLLSHKFFIIDEGYVWLNETKKPGQPGFGARLPRMLTYAVVEDQQLNDKSLVINTHLDHESKEAQREGIKIILSTIDSLLAEDAKYRKKPIENIYITGDFNVDDRDPMFSVLYYSKYKFVSARHVADTYDSDATTFHGFKGPLYEEKCIIDHILFSSKKAVTKFKVLRGEAPYISDHYPVITDFFKA